ncbi:MAG: hypothetical protein JHC39_00650 [Lentimicrobium sp.]|nr:hypothetical protein [Lentimicrobium sp.]
MKKFNKHFQKITFLMFSTALLITSCTNDFKNPNATTDASVLTSKDGLFALSVGVRQVYSTSGMRYIIETPAATAREIASTSDYLTVTELEDGGDIPNINSDIVGLWVNLTRVMGMTESLYDAANNVTLDPGTKSGIKAYANLFRAMSIGNLSINFEQVVIKTSLNNDAAFVPRQQGLLEAVRLLDEAKTILATTPASSDFTNSVLGGRIDLTNTINLMLARFNLYAGNYDAAITNANLVSATSTSVFTYDALNVNPIWERGLANHATGANFFKPQDNFGLPTSIFTFAANDGRLSFYMTPENATSLSGYAVETLKGFNLTQNSPMPIYIPDEAKLILAEANLRKASPNIPASVAALNEVLTDTNDPLGVNANVAPYSGAMDVSSVLLEIYKNRRAELYLSGNCLEDSRRFGRPQPTPGSGHYSDERNRNFYPYASKERDNNPNTPADPSI